MEKRDFSSTRSGSYQYVILESVSSNEAITEYSDTTGNFGTISSTSNKEKLLELQEELYQEYWNLINTGLTERQRKVLKLCAEGKTQTEIAKILNVNQSSITKSINGNVDYSNKGEKKTYGGAKKKIRKLAQNDDKIKDILRRIAELDE